MLIGLAAWFIRLESKVNTNLVDIERVKQTTTRENAEAKLNNEQLEGALYKHLMDVEKHYNSQFFNEFRNALDNRFKQIDNQLLAISSKIDHLSDK